MNIADEVINTTWTKAASASALPCNQVEAAVGERSEHRHRGGLEGCPALEPDQRDGHYDARQGRAGRQLCPVGRGDGFAHG
jgi:hypothetical protein